MSSVKRIKVDHNERGEEAKSSSSDHMKHIQDLPNDVFQHCLEFVGTGNFAFVAPVSKHFYWNYINLGVEMKNNVIDVDVILQQGRNKKTTVNSVLVAAPGLRSATECFLKAPKSFQIEVCRQAAVNGRLDILKCAVAFGIDMDSLFPHEENDIDDDFQIYDISAQIAKIIGNGHLDVIEFLHDEGVDLDDENIMNEIGKRGKASSLHWMASKGIISYWKDTVINYLVRDGEIDILKEHYEASFKNINYTFETCAESGNIEVMNWILQENECKWDSYLFSKAAASGNISMMELCLQNGCTPHERVCSGSMENKNLEAALNTLKWLREKNIPWNEHVCSNAAEYGNLKALKWARENGCPWDEDTFSFAAQYGSIDMLDYCFENKCPVDHDSIYNFPFDDKIYNPSLNELQERSLKVYKWLHQHSIPWGDEASLIAALHGHLETLIWAVENGCPWHEDILGCAIRQFDFPLVEYYIQNLSPMDDYIYVFAMDTIDEINVRRIDDVTDVKIIKMLQMFHDYGIPWSGDIISCAERLGRSNVANWLRCVGCPQEIDSDGALYDSDST